MMYGLSEFMDGSFEVFDITDSMAMGVIEDAKLEHDKLKVHKNNMYIIVHGAYLSTSYFYNKEDRKEIVLGLL